MKTNRREQNKAAQAKRIAAWKNNQSTPDTKAEETQEKPVTALGFIRVRNQEPTIATDHNSGALTPKENAHA